MTEIRECIDNCFLRLWADVRRLTTILLKVLGTPQIILFHYLAYFFLLK